MGVDLNAMIVTIGSPELLDGEEGRRVMAGFYGRLLGMRIVNEGWLLIGKEPESAFKLALDIDGWSDQRPPRWPDPEYPQQMHLDIFASDCGAARDLVVDMGAKPLREGSGFATFADPAGHPFCLYPDADAGDGAPGRIGRVVFDCFSPRSLASFYAGVLGVDHRVEDSPERVVLALGDDRYPDFAFQHAQFVAARWPDDAYPAQMHIDYRFADTSSAVARVEALGGIRLPKLADTEIFADPASHPFCL